MMGILKSFCVAFSIYSKIPVPRFEWGTEDMKYHLCFFPFVGAVIGGVEYAWFRIFSAFGGRLVAGSQNLFFALIAIAIPILITGGFHLDGFLDTADALHSYGDREKKLAILKDPHVGAFAVISFTVLLIFALAGILAIGTENEKSVICLCGIFYISRCLSGISVVSFPKAKNDGMLFTESRAAKLVGAVLLLELAAGIFAEVFFCGGVGIAAVVAMFALFLYYFLMSKRQFGGITGDLAGFFVCTGEVAGVWGVFLAILLGGC